MSAVTASAVCDVGGGGIEEYAGVLDDDRYAEQLDRLGETFEDTLREELAGTLATDDVDADPAVVDDHWNAIVREIDGLGAVFEGRRDAVVQVTDAVAAGLGDDCDDVPDAAINCAVVRGYRTTVESFVDEARHDGLRETLERETGLQVAERSDEVVGPIERLETLLTCRQAVALGDEGLEWLDPVTLCRRDPGDPVTAWRTGFSVADVAAGYPVRRRLPGEDQSEDDPGGRDATRGQTTVDAALFDRLRDGRDQIVVGDRGTGKSTVCKQVACRWADAAVGPVIYRSGETSTALADVGTVEAAIEAAADETLVVVEDAFDPGAVAVHELRQRVPDESTTFLLDARETAWEARESRLRDRLGPEFEAATADLESWSLPELDEDGCRRAIEQFRSVTDDEMTVDRTPATVLADVEAAGRGRLRALGKQLTDPYDDRPLQRGDSEQVDDDPEAYYRRGIARDRAGEYTDAVAEFTRAVEADYDDPEVYYRRGLARGRTGDHRSAREDFTRAIENGYDSPVVYYDRGLARVRTDDHRSAREDFTRAIEAGYDDPEVYYRRGLARNVTGDHHDAVADFTRAIEEGYDDPEIYYSRGLARARTGDHADAVADFTRAIEEGHDDPEVYYSRGLTRDDTGDHADTVADFTRAIEAGYDDPKIYYDRGLAGIRTGDHSGAVADFTRAIEEGHDDPGVYYSRGVARGATGDDRNARVDFTRAVEAGYDDPEAYYTRGVARYNTGDYADAVADLTRAIEAGYDDPDAYYRRGIARVETDDYEAAVEDFDEVLARDPGNDTALRCRAEAHIANGDYEAAVGSAREAATRADTDGDRAVSLLLALVATVALGRPDDDAEAEYRSLCERDIEVPWSLDVLDSWRRRADLADERLARIEELIDLLRAHRE